MTEATGRDRTLLCECGHKVRVRLDGKIQRHSPLEGWRETPWCPRSEQPAHTDVEIPPHPRAKDFKVSRWRAVPPSENTSPTP